MSSIKVSLRKSDLQLLPFLTSVSDIEIGFETVYERLQRQIFECGFILSHEQDADVVLSAEFVCSKSVLKSLISHDQLEIETSFNSALSASEKLMTVPSVVVSKKSQLNQSVKLKQKILHEVSVGLPPNLYGKNKFSVVFSDLFYLELKHWSDVLTASSLLCREYTSNSIQVFKKFLGQKILSKFLNEPRIASRFNKIGRRCKIHPTAILEGCVIGDEVEIGPYSYIRSAIIGHNAIIREHSSIKISVIGRDSFIMPCDMFNSYIGSSNSIFTSILHNSCTGKNVFIGGGSGFSDFNKNHFKEMNQKVSEKFLGAAIGDHSFIGAGLIFLNQQMIPSGTTFINSEMINKVPTSVDKIYAVKAGQLISLPKNFI